MKFTIRMDSFSKLAIAALFVVWLGVVIFGVCYVWRTGDENALSQLLAVVNAPMSAGLVGYLLKSAFENVRKISLNGANPLASVDEPTEEQWSDAAHTLLSGLTKLLRERVNELNGQPVAEEDAANSADAQPSAITARAVAINVDCD